VILIKEKYPLIPVDTDRLNIMSHFQKYIPRNEHPNWPVIEKEAQTLLNKILPLLSPPVPKPIDIIRKAKSYATAIKNYFDNRRLEKNHRHNLWPLYFLWTTHRLCNFRCQYCDDHRGNKYPDLPNDGALSTAEANQMLKIMRTRVPSVLFAGGEPTLRDDLPVLCRTARKLNYYPIIIDTNGSLIHKILERPHWKSWLADIDHLVVSLDSLDATVLAETWVCKHPLNVIRNILLLRDLSSIMRFKLMISTVIQPGLIQHAEDVLNFCNDLKICFCPMPMNVGPKIEKSLLTNAEYLRLVDMILERKIAGFPIAGTIRINERMLRSETLNCRNTLKPHIDYDGRLFWPCKASVHVEPVMVNVLEFDNVDEIYRYASNIQDPTHFQSVCGARCNWSQHYTTDSYVHGLTNPKSLFSEIRSFIKAS
jgi:MoaA/NifB/PqqE/SkfB family radical SAM enzyme